jgi:hypothetical protein
MRIAHEFTLIHLNPRMISSNFFHNARGLRESASTP